MTNSTQAPPAGLFASTQRLLATLLAAVQTRIEIAVTELEEEREHLKALLIYSVLAVVILAMGLVALTVFLTLWLWQWFGAFTLLGVGLILVGTSLLLALYIRHYERTRPRLFSTTLAELRKDAQELPHDQPTP